MTIEYKDSKRIITYPTEYKVHTFTSSGTFAVTGSGNIEYLVVAGGGGGAGCDATPGGSGGGAGGLRTNVSGATSGGNSNAEATYGVTAQNYTITIGSGGSGGGTAGDGESGTDGNDSSIAPASGTTITSIGGGGGGAYYRSPGGKSGGSGGGTAWATWSGTAGGAGTSGQGFAGGNNPDSSSGSLQGGSGGGGAGALGANGGGNGGNGGIGLQSSINGTTTYYAGGGAGALGNSTGSNGTAGSGSIGQGGNGSANSGSGTAGANGIVIVRYDSNSSITATGGTITTVTGGEQSKPTNVQDNSILVEKDTANRYWFNANPLFTDNFSSDNFTHADTKTSVSNNKFNWEIELDNSDDTAYQALDFTLDNSSWVMRFKINFDTLSLTSNPGAFGKFVLASSNAGQSGSFDWIGFERYVSSASNTWGLRYGNNTSGNSGSDNFTTAPSASSTYYMELIRDGSSLTGKMYDNANYTGTPETTTLTISGTVEDLSFFKFYNRSDNTNTGQDATGSIEDLKVWNGVTTASGGGEWTWDKLKYQTNFSSDSGWTMTNKLSVNEFGNMYANGVNATEQYYAYYDLGLLSDTKWHIEIDFKYTNSGGGEGMILGVSSGTSLIWQNGGAKALALYISGAGSIGGRVRYNTTDDHFTSGGSITNNGTWKYLVLERYDVNTMKTHVYSSAEDRRNKTNGTTYTGSIDQSNGDGTDITSLRYLQLGGWYVNNHSGRVLYGYWDNIKVYDGVNW